VQGCSTAVSDTDVFSDGSWMFEDGRRWVRATMIDAGHGRCWRDNRPGPSAASSPSTIPGMALLINVGRRADCRGVAVWAVSARSPDRARIDLAAGPAAHGCCVLAGLQIVVSEAQAQGGNTRVLVLIVLVPAGGIGTVWRCLDASDLPLVHLGSQFRNFVFGLAGSASRWAPGLPARPLVAMFRLVRITTVRDGLIMMDRLAQDDSCAGRDIARDRAEPRLLILRRFMGDPAGLIGNDSGRATAISGALSLAEGGARRRFMCACCDDLDRR